MRSLLLRRWPRLIAVWIPFPCLFLPFTFMKEAYDPWYIDYTSPFVILAGIFYQPATSLAVGVPMIFGYSSSMSAMYAAAFIQSFMLSYFILRAARREIESWDAKQP